MTTRTDGNGVMAIFLFVGVAMLVVTATLVFLVRPQVALTPLEVRYCGEDRPNCGSQRAECTIVGRRVCAEAGASDVCPEGYERACDDIKPLRCGKGTTSSCVCVGFWGCS